MLLIYLWFCRSLEKHKRKPHTDWQPLKKRQYLEWYNHIVVLSKASNIFSHRTIFFLGLKQKHCQLSKIGSMMTWHDTMVSVVFRFSYNMQHHWLMSHCLTLKSASRWGTTVHCCDLLWGVWVPVLWPAPLSCSTPLRSSGTSTASQSQLAPAARSSSSLPSHTPPS